MSLTRTNCERWLKRCQLLICGVTRHSRIDGLVSVLQHVGNKGSIGSNSSMLLMIMHLQYLSVMSDTWLACCGHLTKGCV